MEPVYPCAHREGKVYLLVGRASGPLGLFECVNEYELAPRSECRDLATFKDYCHGDPSDFEDVKYLTWERDAERMLRFYEVKHTGHWQHNSDMERGQEVRLYETVLAPKFND